MADVCLADTPNGKRDRPIVQAMEEKSELRLDASGLSLNKKLRMRSRLIMQPVAATTDSHRYKSTVNLCASASICGSNGHSRYDVNGYSNAAHLLTS